VFKGAPFIWPVGTACKYRPVGKNAHTHIHRQRPQATNMACEPAFRDMVKNRARIKATASNRVSLAFVIKKIFLAAPQHGGRSEWWTQSN